MWKLTVDPLCVIIQSPNPPGSTEMIAFSCAEVIAFACREVSHAEAITFHTHIQKLLILYVSILNSNVNSFNTNMQEK